MIHSFPFYIADWRESESILRLDLAARGLYLEMLVLTYWKADLPVDEQLLASMCRVSRREFAATWPKIKHLFVEVDGRYHHEKVDEIRPRLESWRESRIEAGRKGGSSKRQAIAQAIAKQEPSYSSSKVEAKSKPSSSSSSYNPYSPLSGDGQKPRRKKVNREIEYTADFEAWWAEHPKKAGKADAFDTWKVMSESDREAALAGIKAQRPQMEAKIQRDGNAEFIKHPATWLNKRGWEDEADEPQPEPVYRNPKEYLASLFAEPND